MKGRVAVVTGSTQGIGLAVALAAARAGAESVVVTGRDAYKGAAAAGEVERNGAASLFVAADLEHPSAPDLNKNAPILTDDFAPTEFLDAVKTTRSGN